MNKRLVCQSCGVDILSGSPLGQCPKCLLNAGLESQPAFDPKLQPTTPSPQANSGFIPPTTAELAKLFPQLEILELLGQGGMGAVYKARQKGLDRLVAVKILPPEIGRDPAFAERFTREARALAKLNHPNIVSVYDFGEASGQYYFIMEFVDGVNLRQAIRAGQTTPQECLAIVPQICDALQFAHDEGVVHRDIKPENILLDKKGRVKIADFGLAKLLGQDATDHTLTGTNQVMGTMRYMAPEQMFGSKMVDHRADIYSLGVVFYELLTGEVPMGRFAPPSKKVQIDVRLDEVVLRALEKEPDQRYQQAGEVKTAIEHASIRNEPYRPQRTTLSEARLSRLALAGAIWTPAVWLLTIGIIVGVVIYAQFRPDKLDLRLLLDAISVFCFIVATILASIGTTLLGAIAIGRIRHSQGKVYGMRLAIADALLFPLLLLDCLVFALVAGLVFLAVSAIEIKAIDNSQAGIGLRVLFSSFIPIPIIVWLDYLIVRAVWRWATGWKAKSGYVASKPLEVKTAIEHASIRNDPFRPQRTTLPEARLSRLALAGAIWTPAVWLLTIGIIVGVVIYIESNPGKLHIRNFLDAFTAICAVVGIFVSAIGTTLLGAIAIGRIRHSQGKVYGMRLAIADLLLFPLLLLDVLLLALGFVLSILVIELLVTKPPNSALSPLVPLLLALLVIGPFIVWLDYLIVRAVWRWATGWKAESSYVASKPLETKSFPLPTDNWSVAFRSWPGFIRQSIQIILAIVYLGCIFFMFSFSGGRSSDEAGTKIFHRIGMPTPWLEFTNYSGPIKHGFDWTIHIFSWPVLAAVVGCIALALTRAAEKAKKGTVHSMQWHYWSWALLLAINIGLALFSTNMMPALKIISPSASANSASTDAVSTNTEPLIRAEPIANSLLPLYRVTNGPIDHKAVFWLEYYVGGEQKLITEMSQQRWYTPPRGQGFNGILHLKIQDGYTLNPESKGKIRWDWQMTSDSRAIKGGVGAKADVGGWANDPFAGDSTWTIRDGSPDNRWAVKPATDMILWIKAAGKNSASIRDNFAETIKHNEVVLVLKARFEPLKAGESSEASDGSFGNNNLPYRWEGAKPLPPTQVEIEQSSKTTVDENGSSNEAKLKMTVPVTNENDPTDEPITMIGGGSGSKTDGLEILCGTNYLVPNQPALTFSTVITYEEPTRLAFAAVFKHDVRFGKPFKMPANAKQSGIGNPQATIQQIIEWQGKQVTIDYEIHLDKDSQTVESERLRVNGEEHDLAAGRLLLIDFDASPPKITYAKETLTDSLLRLKADSNDLVEILKREVPVMFDAWRKKEVLKN